MHLIPTEDTPQDDDEVNANVFRNLDSPVSEGGDNFSTGFVVAAAVYIAEVLKYRREKQLLCMARAILKRSRVLVMDEVNILITYPCIHITNSSSYRRRRGKLMK